MSTILDATRTKAFAEQALGIVNGGCLSLMLSVGHRTGLFDTLATLEPSSAGRIAAAAGLNERYVREWLGAMVTGRIIEYDPAAQTYRLPREHAASLTRSAGPENLAELAQVVAMLGQVEGGIVEAKADAFPQIALDSEWGQSRSPSLLNSPDFEDIIEQFPGGSFEPSTQELSRAVIEVTQPLWTFGKVGAAIDLAELVADAAGAQISTAELDTAAAVAEAYYRLLAAREGLSTIEADRAWFMEHGRLTVQRSKAISREIGGLCRKVRPLAVDLVDAWAVPPEMLRSPDLIG